ncbi:MAG TPA: hypothetical protein VF870_08735 [Ignavibacteriaceae bacterium]
MEKLILYKIKGFNTNLNNRFKALVVARSYDEAFNLGNELAGPGGWISSIKETGKEIFLKGEKQNDQSE